MKAIFILTTAVLIVACGGVWASPTAPAKVSLDANDMSIKDAVEAITKQTGAQALLDGDVTGKVTASLNEVECDRAIDIVAKSLRLDWKRVELAVGVETTVSTEKLKAAIAALSALDIPAMSLADPVSGKVSLVARGLGRDAAAEVKLPEGQKWQTYYLISKPPAPKPEQTAKQDDAQKNVQQEVADRTGKIMAMSPEERQSYFQSEFHMEMQLPQDARKQIWQDRIAAFGNLMRDPVNGPMLQQEFQQAFQSIRRQERERNQQ